MSGPSTTGGEGGIPRGAVLGGVVLIVGTIALAALARPPRPAPEPAEAARLLTFVDRSDGAVVVLDTAADTVAVVSPGTGGFVRGALRGLSRERQRRERSRTEPFELALLAGNRLVLTDPSTGHRIDLAAFGPTNEGVFRSFLEPQRRSR